VLALLLATAACDRGAAHLASLKATSRTARVRVFLIDREEQGEHPSCGEKAVPVEVTLPQKTPALAGSLEGLFALGRDPFDTRTGLYNALHASPLTIEKIERKGPAAIIRLHGYLELGEPCDADRALAQLTETVLQFPDVQQVQFYLEGKPLREALAALARK
jgi:hypothetical protein